MEKGNKFVYVRNGKKYEKVEIHQTIKPGAMHSYCGGELNPIQNPETIGQFPFNFSDDREFYNPI